MPCTVAKAVLGTSVWDAASPRPDGAAAQSARWLTERSLSKAAMMPTWASGSETTTANRMSMPAVGNRCSALHATSGRRFECGWERRCNNSRYRRGTAPRSIHARCRATWDCVWFCGRYDACPGDLDAGLVEKFVPEVGVAFWQEDDSVAIRLDKDRFTAIPSLIPAHAPDLNPLASFGPSQGCLVPRVFAGCYVPLLGVGPSRRYLHSLCAGAWTLTPRRLFGALTDFA
jgi:hypothetical protein